MVATHEFTGVGTTWYVSSEVTGSSGSGTISDPWSLEYAGEGADDQIQPGDRVLLRGQRPGGPFVENYQPYTIGGQSRGTGYEISVSGTATKPITWAPYPGEVVTFADYIDTSDGWTKVTTREDGSSFPITANVYESNFTVAGNVHAVHAYFRHNDRFFVIGALRGPTGAGPYTTHTQIAALYADTSRFRMDGAFYPGPCIIRLGNGKLRVRLDECVTEGHEYGTDNPFFGETTQIYPASTDPEDVDLRIYRQDDCGLLITGSFNIVEDMFFDGFPRACIKDSGDNNIIRRNSGWSVSILCDFHRQCRWARCWLVLRQQLRRDAGLQ
jgi:hypothetical protein